MLSVGMSPVQWTDKTPPDLLAGGPHLIWEQEAAGSNPAIPTRSEHISILAEVPLGAKLGAMCYRFVRGGTQETRVGRGLDLLSCPIQSESGVVDLSR